MKDFWARHKRLTKASRLRKAVFIKGLSNDLDATARFPWRAGSIRRRRLCKMRIFRATLCRLSLDTLVSVAGEPPRGTIWRRTAGGAGENTTSFHRQTGWRSNGHCSQSARPLVRSVPVVLCRRHRRLTGRMFTASLRLIGLRLQRQGGNSKDGLDDGHAELARSKPAGTSTRWRSLHHGREGAPCSRA